MALNINVFLEQKYKEVEMIQPILTEDIYDFVKDIRLKHIFAVLHQEFNRLIKFMYSKTNRHYNAEQSRDLIKYITIYEELNHVLKKTDKKFTLDDNYDKFLKQCKTFLAESEGSTIPADLNKINIIDYEPIFSLSSKIEVDNPNEKAKYQLKLIGEGSYAKVFKYHDEFYDKDIIVKRANKDLNEKELIRFRKEFDVMKNMNSPYILQVYKYNEEKNEYYAEYADTTLHEFIQKNNSKLTKEQRRNIIMQILKGFNYIHEKGMLHRDISLTNILIKKYDDGIRIKISDFGLVKEKDSNLTSLESEIKGSLNDESNLSVVGFANYSMLHETYALTRLILYVLTGKTNLDKVKEPEIREFVLKGTNGELSKRFADTEELAKAFTELYPKIQKSLDL